MPVKKMPSDEDKEEDESEWEKVEATHEIFQTNPIAVTCMIAS
jgi:hypothetical protein